MQEVVGENLALSISLPHPTTTTPDCSKYQGSLVMTPTQSSLLNAAFPNLGLLANSTTVESIHLLSTPSNSEDSLWQYIIC